MSAPVLPKSMQSGHIFSTRERAEKEIEKRHSKGQTGWRVYPGVFRLMQPDRSLKDYSGYVITLQDARGNPPRKVYRICYSGSKTAYYDTVAQAKAAAQKIYDKTGVFVGIEHVAAPANLAPKRAARKNGSAFKRRTGKTYRVLGNFGTANTPKWRMLAWNNKQAQTNGVFSLTAMSWTKESQYPVVFAQKNMAEVFSNHIDGPAVRKIIEAR